MKVKNTFRALVDIPKINQKVLLEALFIMKSYLWEKFRIA